VSAHAPEAATIIPVIGEDGTLVPGEKLAVHRLGLRHLAVSVFVFDGARLLVQRRAAGKYHCPGQWANTCCSHPAWGEGVAAAAFRRLHEELGVRLTLEACGRIDYVASVGNGMVENEHVAIFMGQADRARLVLRPDPAEVDAVRWVSLGVLMREARTAPERFAPWFRIYLERWEELDLGPRLPARRP
jgi:isopentenyl-diphosphate delta-isomerase